DRDSEAGQIPNSTELDMQWIDCSESLFCKCSATAKAGTCLMCVTFNIDAWAGSQHTSQPGHTKACA
ncbi:MAG: hypothetical protein ACI83P_001818, partial [Janthinobacterium sp.]